MWSKLGSQSKSSSAAEVDFLSLCKDNVRVIEDFATSGNLLNQRQCQDLSFKLLKITQNIRELLLCCGAPAVHFRAALENLYRFLEKAKFLLSECGDKDWCKAAVFQIQNENAFREILLDVGFCYNAIYELAKSKSEGSKVLPEDLRPSIFRPTSDSDVRLDLQDIQKRLEDVANEPESVKSWGRILSDKEALKRRCLARYLLVKLNSIAKQSQASSLDTCSEIFWEKEDEPSGTWGKIDRFLGAGSGASGVCKRKWMDIPCAKKEFHPQEADVFFLKEAGILAHLKHPCIVNFFCCGNGQEKGDRFIAMELMEKSLFDLIEEQKKKGVYFSLPVVVDMMVQMARGMCYLHSGGVAHRDLKPSNVVVNTLSSMHLMDHYCVKLVDFGMSKTKVEVLKSNTMTALGIGTTRYKAPEVYTMAHLSGKGKATWFQADVFSFAMTIAHVLSLKTPFGGTNTTKVYHELVSGQRPKLPAYCPQELVGLLEDCWDTNPNLRPSFIEICTRLEKFQHKILRVLPTLNQDLLKEVNFDGGFEFITAMIKEQSLIQKPSVECIDDEMEVINLAEVDEVEDEVCDLKETKKNDLASIIPCTCGRTLKFLPSNPYSKGNVLCNICWKHCTEEVYHCENCQFDAHQDCAEIKDEVNVFFHADPLHLLVQNYYDNNPNVTCNFCEESLQGSAWVYNCQHCNFNVHALCTKHPQKVINSHSHPLTLVQSPPRENASCECCNGDFKGYRYTCTRKLCSFDRHPSCNILSRNPVCIFDSLHRLHLYQYYNPKGFNCGRCGSLGLSGRYHCKHCDVDIHLDCVNNVEEEEGDWNGAYEQFMLEYENKGDQDKMDTIAQLLDMLLISSGLETSSSSSSRPPPVLIRVQPTVQTPASSEAPSSNALDDLDLQRKIAGETEERKAKRMAVKEAIRQKVMAGLMLGQDATLENLVRLLQDLQRSELDARVLAGAQEKLRKLQDFVEGLLTSKIRQVPRIALSYDLDWEDSDAEDSDAEDSEVADSDIEDSDAKPNFTIRLATYPNDRWLTFLCEGPGHEHIVRSQMLRSGITGHYVPADLVGEHLKPLLAFGLQVVKMAMTCWANDITDLESVTLPNLGEKPWDLQAIDLEKHAIQTTMAFEDDENVELQKGTEDTAAEWLRSYLEDYDISIIKEFGLVRIRYTTAEHGDLPRYKQGSVAWLCTEHQKQGLEAGVLESYPFRIYHNLEYDEQRGFL